MSDRKKDLKAKIDKELRFIRFCELNSFFAERAYERLGRIEHELFARRKLNLEQIQSDIARRQQ